MTTVSATDGPRKAPPSKAGPGPLPDLNLAHEADRLRAVAEHLHETGITLPVTGWHVPFPPPEMLAFYTGLAAIAAMDLIEWPLALIIAVGHELARSRRPGVRGLAESVESV
jgi:hypothetical protein